MDLKYNSYLEFILKILYSILFFCSSLLLLYTLRKFKKDINPIRRTLSFLFISAIFATISNLVVLLSQNYILSLIFYSFFFIGINLIIYFLVNFTIQDTNLQFNKKTTKLFLKIIFCLDSISLLLNIFFQHSFSIIEVVYKNTPYLLAEHFLIYQLHLVLSYICLAIVFILLLYKTIISPRMYRIKYISVLTSFIIVVIGDAFYVFSHSPIDFSVVLFSLTGLLIYYLTCHFTPHKLIEKSLSLVVENMEHAVVFYDNVGNCVYRNKYFEDLVKISLNEGLNLEQFFHENFKKNQSKNSENILQSQEYRQSLSIQGVNHFFKVSYHSLKDERGKYIGSFILIQDRTKDEEKIKYERYLSTHDNLTGLYNHFHFYEKAQQTIEKNNKSEFIMLCVQICNFKFLKDFFGNYTVDEFMKKISHTLKNLLHKNDTIGKLDTNTFAILFEKNNFDIEQIKNKLSGFSSISEDKYFPIKIAFGIYEIDNIKNPISVMCDRAKIAITNLPESEDVGYFTTEMKNRILFEQIIVGDFPKALQDNQFKLFLQPQFTEDKKLFGIEVLTRWFHPSEGTLDPDSFIKLFEDNGIITQLDMYIWEEAAKLIKKWNKKGYTLPPLSINVSTKDLYYIDIISFFKDLLEKYDIKPSQLKLEITETALLVDNKTKISVLSKLREMGFEIAIDDFGARSSSLNILKDIKFDFIKLDLLKLSSSQTKENSERMIVAIINLVRNLNIKIMTEGVETKNQYEFLKSNGCNYFQGFYLEKPMDVLQFENKYIK